MMNVEGGYISYFKFRRGYFLHCVFFFSMLAIFFVVISCSRNCIRERLLLAESLGEQSPDSMLALLKKLPEEEISSGDDKALFSLLTTEAGYRTGKNETDTSVIDAAVGFYSGGEDDYHEMKSFYYKGIILLNNKAYGDASLTFMEAKSAAESTGDSLWLGRIFRGIADSHDAVGSYSSSALNYAKALECFEKYPDLPYSNYALNDLARTNLYLGDFESSSQLAEKALECAEKENDPYLKSNALRILGASSLEQKEPRKALTYLSELKDMGKPYFLASDWLNLGLSRLDCGMNEAAWEADDSLLQYFPGERWLSCRLAIRNGDSDHALDLLSVIYAEQNKEIRERFSDGFNSMIEESYGLKMANTSLLLKVEKRKRWIVGIISLFLVLLVVVIYIFRSRNLRREIYHNITIADNLKEILKDKEQTLDSLDEKLKASEKLFREQELRLHKEKEEAIEKARNSLLDILSSRINTADRLCGIYYRSTSDNKSRNRIEREIEGLIDSLRLDHDSAKELEKTVNSNIDGLMERFRCEFPGLNDYEYHLYLLLVLRFSSQAICLLQGITPDKLYNRKSSLKRKLASSGKAHSDEFLGFI